MKKGVSFDWDETCRNAFRSIKFYLLKLPVLVAPMPGHPLILYIATQEYSVGALLVQENDEGKESALYYLSRMMTPNELKYSPIEKICLALVFAIQKLKHYFQAHIAVKGQVLADFLADHPIPAEWELSNDLPDENVIVIEVTPPWKMYFDGASHKEGAGAGVIFITSDGERLIGWLGDVEIEHMPRKDNKQADALAKLASTLTTLEDNAHVRYQRRSNSSHGRNSFRGLRCSSVWPKTALSYKEDGLLLAYYVKDCINYTQRCQACQFHANFIHQPPEPLLPTVASWPFDAWGLDVVGPLTKCSAGHLYILAATDYFSKWAEAVPLKEVKKENVADFIRINIIYRYEIPRYIITDNRKPFCNSLIDKLTQKFNFK
ncbi:UNVERIFIED_CONTAM: hypothetical protein Scaly_1655800 [Sesamum calycinum]|uniref:Integrase catalytic domain-containing protein n=1 Tax=Sesamum calycinum TaxID=2727403 RepID=A0AAW2NT02_9LAMI